VGLPITIGVASSVMPKGETEAQQIINNTKGGLTEACLQYALSKNDTKMEREAKTAIDEAFGDGSNYREVCSWVLG